VAEQTVVFRGPAASGADLIIEGTRVPCAGSAYYVPDKLVKRFTALPQIAQALKAGRLIRQREVKPVEPATPKEAIEPAPKGISETQPEPVPVPLSGKQKKD
jgi:hypothetical protein